MGHVTSENSIFLMNSKFLRLTLVDFTVQLCINFQYAATIAINLRNILVICLQLFYNHDNNLSEKIPVSVYLTYCNNTNSVQYDISRNCKCRQFVVFRWKPNLQPIQIYLERKDTVGNYFDHNYIIGILLFIQFPYLFTVCVFHKKDVKG